MKLWKWIVLMVIPTILILIIYGLFEGFKFVDINIWIRNLLLIIGAFVTLGGYLLFEKWYRCWSIKPAESKIICNGVLKNTGSGMLIGFLYFCAVVLIMFVLGAYKAKTYHFDAIGLLLEFTFWLLAAVGEECVFRGVIYRLIRERWNYRLALIVTSLLFGLVHWTNPSGTLFGGISIAIEAGLLLGAAYELSGSLWLPIGIHWTWNFTQGNVFGFIVSGTPMEATSVITPVVSGNELITGGTFGAEASVISVILGFAISCWMIYRIQKNKKMRDISNG